MYAETALFGPATVADLAVQSRIVMAPMSRYACPDALPHGSVAEYYTRRAAGGVGLIITEGTYIPHPSAASYEGVPWICPGCGGWARDAGFDGVEIHAPMAI